MTGSCASSSKPIQEVINETTERSGGQYFLLHIVTCANTSLTEVVVDKGINTLRRYWIGSILILPKHYIAKEILTSQDGRSGATERLWAYSVSHLSCPCDH